MKDQHFDRWQFGDRRPHPVSAESDGQGSFTTPGISFDDFSRMSTMQRKTTGERRLPTPSWAVNDKELQHLLVIFIEERTGFRKHKDPLVEKKKDLTTETLKARLEKAKEKVMARRDGQRAVMHRLNEQYVHLQQQGFLSDVEQMRCRQLENEIQGHDTYLRYTENGGADVVAAIVYLYYRAGMDSVGVAAELGIKPPHVRQTLWRLHRVADYMAGTVRPRITKEERDARKLARAEKLRLEAEDRRARAVERVALAQQREAERAERKLRADAETAERAARAAQARAAARVPRVRVEKPARVRRYNLSKICDFCGGPLPYRAHKACKAEACQTAYAEQRNSRSTPRKAARPEPEVASPVVLKGNIPRWLESVVAAV